MNVTRVCCQGCGADLQIDETIRFVTCNYCNARLEVLHDPTITHTRRLDQIERRTNDMAKQLKVIKLQNDLIQLDKEWEKFRKAVLISDENGRFSEPSEATGASRGIVGIVLVILWFVGCVANQSFGAALIGPLLFGIAIYLMKDDVEIAESFGTQKARYEAARKNLLHRIDAESGN